MPVWREEFLVRPLKAYFFTAVIWEQRRTRCESVWFVCPCVNVCVIGGVGGSRRGFPITLLADPDKK